MKKEIKLKCIRCGKIYKLEDNIIICPSPKCGGFVFISKDKEDKKDFIGFFS